MSREILASLRLCDFAGDGQEYPRKDAKEGPLSLLALSG